MPPGKERADDGGDGGGLDDFGMSALRKVLITIELGTKKQRMNRRFGSRARDLTPRDVRVLLQRLGCTSHWNLSLGFVLIEPAILVDALCGSWLESCIFVAVDYKQAASWLY